MAPDPVQPAQTPVHPSTPPLALPVLVDTPAALERMLSALAGASRLALDTESNSLYRYFYRVCLIQISIPSADFLVDPLRLPDLTPLGRTLADPQIEKVCHAAENDTLALQRDFGFRFASVFDTMMAARILGWRRVNLAALLEEQFGVTLDKRTQLTDWGQRPLTQQQLDYGRFDTHYLLPLRDLLAEQLRQRRRWEEAREAFTALENITYVDKPFDPDGFWRQRGARDLRGDQLAVLRELYLWRDAQARALDRPPFKVLGDDSLLLLAQEQPRRTSALPLTAWQRERFGAAIVEAIDRGRSAPPPAPPARHHNGNGRPDPAVFTRFDQLRAWRGRCAAERGVENDVVLNNDTLMAIARAAPATLSELAALGALGPWKLQEYGPALLATLAGG